jgi:dCMP deaminase
MRPGWDSYFLQITNIVATRSTCGRRQVGAIIVKGHDILATGYNGAPKSLDHCDVTGCLRADLGIKSGEQLDRCRAIHAEQNAILQATRHGINIQGADLYCTNTPCLTCAKMIINAGIKHIYFMVKYNDDYAIDMVKSAGIQLTQLEE